jgi:hypothetical protein
MPDMPNARSITTDPITDRWPDDTAEGLLEDVIWALSGKKGAFVDDLTIEKLRVLRQYLMPATVVLYDVAALGRSTATASVPNTSSPTIRPPSPRARPMPSETTPTAMLVQQRDPNAPQPPMKWLPSGTPNGRSGWSA